MVWAEVRVGWGGGPLRYGGVAAGGRNWYKMTKSYLARTCTCSRSVQRLQDGGLRGLSTFLPANCGRMWRMPCLGEEQGEVHIPVAYWSCVA